MEIDPQNLEGGEEKTESMFGFLADGDQKGQTAQPAVGTDAANSVVAFKGLRGGRPRKDGLVPGSPEAIEADRRKDADRKRLKREREAATVRRIPVFESPLDNVSGPLPPTLPGAQNTFSTQGGSPGNSLGPEIVKMVEWLAEDTAPLLDEAIPTLQEWREAAHERKLRKSNIPEDDLEGYLADCKWSPRLTAILQERGAKLMAKYLNMAGVSAAYKDEIIFGCALLAVAASEIRIMRRLDKLIALAKKP